MKNKLYKLYYYIIYIILYNIRKFQKNHGRRLSEKSNEDRMMDSRKMVKIKEKRFISFWKKRLKKEKLPKCFRNFLNKGSRRNCC